MAKPTFHNIRLRLEAIDADLCIVGNDMFDKKVQPYQDKAAKECRILLRQIIEKLKPC